MDSENNFSETENNDNTGITTYDDVMGLDDKLIKYFDGKIVRKDLTKQIKSGANVPVYVLEYLLGKYCSYSDSSSIRRGVETVKNILADNYVRPDESEKILSKLREDGRYSIIDIVSVHLNYKEDRYEANFSNMGLKGIPIAPQYPTKYERLLGGNIWCMIEMEYDYDEADKNNNPFKIRNLLPIQMPSIELDDILNYRNNFTKDEWIDLLLRSSGMEPTQFDSRVKWLLLLRLIPLVESNYNLCELGPRGTGKSHVYKEISPNSILVSGGQTTVANLFYNMRTEQVGLVGMWDCVAFDEVAGIKFKDQDGIAILKDYMASGSFSRGKDSKTGKASIVYVGNINQSVDTLLRTSSLFDPFPSDVKNDTAFFDRMHCYLPGWEIPKYRPEFFTNQYGFITDYFAEFMREMRKKNFIDAYSDYFKLGHDLSQRDVTAVQKTVSGLMKLIYPNGKFTKEDVREVLEIALESRRRVKEQLKRIGGMEFYDVNLSYIDLEEDKETFVGVAEQGSDKLIPEGKLKAGHLFAVGPSFNSGKIGVYKLETEMMKGKGKFTPRGLGSKKEVKESVETAYSYLKSNGSSISGSISTTDNDYFTEVQDLNGIGLTKNLTISTFIGLCSVALDKPVVSSMVVLGNLSIGGTIEKVENLADTLQVCLDAGAKKILIPMSNAADLGSAPPELIGKFDIKFYNTAEEAVMKALGVE